MEVNDYWAVIGVITTMFIGGVVVSSDAIETGSIAAQDGDIVQEPEIDLPDKQPEGKSFWFRNMFPFPNKVEQGEKITAKLAPGIRNINGEISGSWVAYIDVEDSPDMIKLDEGNFRYANGGGPLVIVEGEIPVEPDVAPPTNMPDFEQDLIGNHEFVVYAKGKFGTGESAFISDNYETKPQEFRTEVFINEAELTDSDKDGINDEIDNCPETKGPESNNGCPIKDSDDDGIKNENDQCPNTSEGVQVDKTGCKITTDNGGDEQVDSDEDGVYDNEDQCPNNWGQKANGCPKGDSDGDGLVDSSDNCPNKYGTKSDGCPTLIDKILNLLGLQG